MICVLGRGDILDSILESVKKCVGISDWDTSFDDDLIFFINSNFLALEELGLKEAKDFSVSNSDTLWTDLMQESSLLNCIKSWIFYKVRMQFDAPTGSLADSYNSMISECEWRINSYIDYGV